MYHLVLWPVRGTDSSSGDRRREVGASLALILSLPGSETDSGYTPLWPEVILGGPCLMTSVLSGL